MNHEKKNLYTPQYNINKSITDPIKISKTFNSKNNIQKRNYYTIQNLLYNKWNDIIINFEEYKINNKKELKKLTRLGIPDNLRGFIWQKFSGIEKSSVKNKYQEYKENNKNLPNKNEEDIIKDLFRTSHSTFFKNKFGLGQINLYNVLSTFSNQSETGYVQGMSFLCASFLSYMNPYKSQLLNEIQLTKKMGNVPNLKILFNDNDNFSSFDNKKKYKSTRPTGSNLFRRNISQNFIGTLTDDYIITDEKNIDNFNSKIIKNRNWGSNNEKLGDKINYFVKPHKSNHIRELGFRIVNTRMPRDRKFVFSSNFLPNRKIGFENLKDNDNKEKNIDINSK